MDGFDLTSLTGTRPEPVDRTRTAKDLLKRLAPLLVALPAVWKGGGAQSAAAFLSGLQEARDRRQRDEERAQQQAFAQQLQLAQLASLDESRVAAAADRDRRTQEQADARKDAMMRDLMAAASSDTLSDPASVAALMDLFRTRAAGAGVPASTVDAAFMGVNTPTRLLANGVRNFVRHTDKALLQQWMDERRPIRLGTGQNIPFDQWSQYVPGAVDATGSVSVAPPKPPEAPPAQEWVYRNGRLIPIRKGMAQPGDRPFDAVATRQAAAGATPPRRPVTSSDATKLADYVGALSDVATLAAALTPGMDPTTGREAEPTTGWRAQVGANLPNWVTEVFGWGANAKSRQAVIDRVKQVIGKTLEGGVLRKEDEIKYVKILPTIQDPVAVVRTKLEGLDRAVRDRHEIQLNALEDAGFDITRFRDRPLPVATGTSDAENTTPDAAVGTRPTSPVGSNPFRRTP